MARPKAFVPDDALEAAMRVFWQAGFEETSLDDLTSAMGINRPSLYATFGNKEDLFLAALDRYQRIVQGPLGQSLFGSHSQLAGLRAFFACLIRQFTNASYPPGCFLINSVLECAGRNDRLGKDIEQRFARLLEVLRGIMKAGQQAGEITMLFDERALATYVASNVAGMALTARTGCSQKTLQRVAEIALSILPAAPQGSARQQPS